MADISNHYLPVDTILEGQEYQYRIQKVLGEGTFGITYLAKAKISISGKLGHLYTEIDVAIKEFFMKDFNERQGTEISAGNHSTLFVDYRKKFQREALSLSKMEHKGIVKVIEAFDANNTSYYVMEYISGGSLNDEIKQKGRLSIKRVQELIPQICQSLSYMHQKKVLHLDLKPQNIMIDGTGAPILIDFGISKAFDMDGNPETTTLIGGGTDGYAPLEQSTHDNNGQFTATLDIYAFGGTLYKMLTGKQPPSAIRVLNDQSILERNLFKADAPESLIRFIERAMSPLQSGRIQNVNEFLEKFLVAIGDVKDEQTEYTIISENKNKRTEEGILRSELKAELNNEELRGTLKSVLNSEPKEKDISYQTPQNDSGKIEDGLIGIIRKYKIHLIGLILIIGCTLLYINKRDGISGVEESGTINDSLKISLTEEPENIPLNTKIGKPDEKEIQFVGRTKDKVGVGEQFLLTYEINNSYAIAFKAGSLDPFDAFFNGKDINNTFEGFVTLMGPSQYRTNDSIQYNYILMSEKPGKYKFPAATVEVNGKEYQSNEIEIEVLPIDETFVAKAPSHIKYGEQFKITYTVNSINSKNFRLINDKYFDILMGPSKSINGNSVTYSYYLKLKEKNLRYIRIPRAIITVDGKDYISNDFVMTILQETTTNNKTNISKIQSNDKITFVATALKEVLEVGEQFRITFTVNTQNIKEFRAPSLREHSIGGLEVLMGPSRSTKEGNVMYTYILMANEVGTFYIPGAKIITNGKEYQSNGITIKVIPASQN